MMAGYLPVEWRGKHVAVVWGGGSGNIEATVIDNNEGGLTVEVIREGERDKGDVRKAFIPWPAVRYVELLEEADEEDTEFRMERPW